METLIGIALVYAYIHAIVIVFKKLGPVTSYERVVLWAAFIAMVLTFMGLVMA